MGYILLERLIDLTKTRLFFMCIFLAPTVENTP